MTGRTGAIRLRPFSAALAVLVTGLVALAQTPKAPPGAGTGMDEFRKRVPLPTADGAELVGTYYRSLRGAGRDTPCVILVHRWGADRTKGDWDTVAAALQKDGFAVLTFDLRGHGESTAVRPEFWTFAPNVRGIRGAGTTTRRPTAIRYTDFKTNYFPWLVNDVLAARRFLEIKNDAGEVNTNSIIVIGAQEGASLGLLFTAAEFARVYRTGFTPLLSEGTPHNAGQDIAAGIWLSLMGRPNQSHFNSTAWIRAFPQIKTVPMLFVYGEKDRAAHTDADAVFNALAQTDRTRTERNRLTMSLDVKGTDLAGVALLGQPALGVGPRIVEFIKKVMAERKAVPWAEVRPDINRIPVVNLQPFGFQP